MYIIISAWLRHVGSSATGSELSVARKCGKHAKPGQRCVDVGRPSSLKAVYMCSDQMTRCQ